jgi:hypothetical protein
LCFGLFCTKAAACIRPLRRRRRAEGQLNAPFVIPVRNIGWDSHDLKMLLYRTLLKHSLTYEKKTQITS